MFKVGDLIVGRNNGLYYTNIDMYLGRVESLWVNMANNKQYMDIRILKHKNKAYESVLMPSPNMDEYYELNISK